MQAQVEFSFEDNKVRPNQTDYYDYILKDYKEWETGPGRILNWHEAPSAGNIGDQWLKSVDLLVCFWGENRSSDDYGL